ncbi:DNA circularization N-terminal domain-containing protein [Gluconacetobacter entanii]|uniref:DNA circularization protein n=1 Tax=Gluconacetobacter entanii TaxID=108528 RepID=UPI001C935F81|nr:DNA circularization N-terminal domain-containing protein [Gluconacetobacter entanii]MBY4641569.1 DNA circularization N-terminal domain-containing protein [Gluconacetobacter entanii]MCW4582032.1 DNA circularization N-terminal domain-containing protein [Gluconacetobacter entanii]MCW4585226.1 DNA circularization N-terminal domain-containing protein [Gluconacetobacter entanii]MCW4588803.1 DNA circularization N-terminal domain-containing protein [Gluconacetobacter entanii]
MANVIATLAEEYLQGSFRGVPFVVVGSGGSNGRNFQIHRYPFRDQVWAEDLGRTPRSYRIRGFLIGPECLAQRDLLVMAAETQGPGTLVHPTVGAMQAALTRFDWYERDGVMGIVDIEMELVETVNWLSSTITLVLDAAIGLAAATFGAASASDYTSDTLTPYGYGASVLGAGRAIAADWGAGAVAAIRSPSAVAAAMGSLPGNLGRYVGGNGATVDQAATESTLLDALTANRQVVSANVAALADATDATVLATAILAVPESVRTSIADPAGQIAVLTPLATYDATVVASDAPIGGAIATVQAATATLCRQAALLSLANACADWQPSSSNDAQAMRTRIGGMLDDAATAAADAGSDATFQALRSLRAQVLQDLANRGARLPDVITVTRNAPLPALVLGQQLYANGARAPDLIRRANPIHPAFMPTEFEALSS